MESAKIKKNPSPIYDEASAFYITLAVIITAIFHYDEMFLPATATTMLILIAICIGTLLSIYHAFSKANKTQFQKEILMYYIGLIMVLIGIGVTIYRLATANFSGIKVWSIIIYLFNIYYTIITGIVILSKDAIYNFFDDRNAGILEIFFGSLIIIGILGVGSYTGTHWTMNLSLCMVYVVGIHKFIRKAFISKH